MGRMKVCPTPGCPRLIPRQSPRCPPCATRYEQQRGSSTERGYGAEHQRIRAEVAPTVWGKPCARCGKPILIGQQWHLDHDDLDRTRYLGPSHAGCNVAAASGAKRTS